MKKATCLPTPLVSWLCAGEKASHNRGGFSGRFYTRSASTASHGLIQSCSLQGKIALRIAASERRGRSSRIETLERAASDCGAERLKASISQLPQTGERLRASLCSGLLPQRPPLRHCQMT